MKFILNTGLSAQVVEIELTGDTIEELVAAGEIDNISDIWDILRGEAGDVPVPPSLITAPSASTGSIEEGGTLTFTGGTYAGDDPITVTRVLRIDGAVVDSDFSELVYDTTITGTNRVLTMTETATNAAGSLSTTVTVNITRIPVAPSVNTPVQLSPASVSQNQTITITPPTWNGDTPLTVDFTATLGGVDVTGDVVVGASMTYTPPTTGQFEITFSATNSAGGPAVSSADLIVAAFSLVNTGLSLSTANIMVQGESQAVSFMFDTWAVDEDPARPSHEWSQVFRSAYSGSHFGPINGGAGPLPGGLPGLGNGAVIGPLNGTEITFNSGTFPAGNDPRNSLANFQGLLIWERANAGRDGTFADPYRWDRPEDMEGAASDFRGEWAYILRAAQNGIKTIFLAGPKQPMIPNDADRLADGTSTAWRANQARTDKSIRVRQQCFQSMLVRSGYADVSIFIIPFHLLELKLHDDIVNSDPAKPASIDSYYLYHAEDAVYTAYNGHHPYMGSRLWSYAAWCLAYSVMFATSPQGITNAASTHSITTDEATYLQDLAWDIAQDYYPTGLGGTDAADELWTLSTAVAPMSRFTDEDLPNLNPFANENFIDQAGTNPAGNGDFVGRCQAFASVSPTERPTLSNNALVFTNDPMSMTFPSMFPKFGMMIASFTSIGDLERILQFGSGDFTISIEDNEYFNESIQLVSGGDFMFIGVNSAWFDGRDLFIEWSYGSAGQPSFMRVIDTGAAINSGAKLTRQEVVSVGNEGLTTSATVGGPIQNSGTNMTISALHVSDEIPSDNVRKALYQQLEVELGTSLWFPELYGTVS